MTGSTTSSGDYQSDDAKQLAEDIVAGEEKAPEVDVSSDYEAAKAYSVSEVDRSSAGAEAAAAVTSPELEVPQPEQTELKAKTTGDPEEFLDVAKDINPVADASSNVDDDLVKKALDMGKPGQQA
ncbi:MAG TPA: hypothetical protein V6D03_03935 [Candidatus Caenarcaniphilales bacterium]